MTEMKCYKCGHEWNYKGFSIHYMTCPICYAKIKVDRAKKLVKGGKKK